MQGIEGKAIAVGMDRPVPWKSPVEHGLVVALGLWYLYLLANNLQQGCKYVYVCFKYVKYIKLFKPMWATYM